MSEWKIYGLGPSKTGKARIYIRFMEMTIVKILRMNYGLT